MRRGRGPGLGLGRGKVFPESRARSLLHPARRLVQSPARAVAKMGLDPADRVLEVGCGPGYFTAELARAVPQGGVVGLDLQSGMLRMATSRAVGLVSVCHVQGDAAVLPFRRSSFDAAVVILVLGEIPDVGRCLDEIARVLRGGGHLVLCESRRDSDFVRFADLVALVEPHGFSLAGRRGAAWEYTARFTRR